MKFKYFVFFLVLLFIVTGKSLYAQLYSGPAFGSITGGDSISTIDVEGVISPFAKVKHIFNPYWAKLDPPLVDDVFNNTPALAPPGSNFQTDLAVSKLKLSVSKILI